MPIARTPASSSILNGSLWIAQVLIFMSFTWAAYKKVATPIPQLAGMWPWVASMPMPYVRALGLIDLAGGIGVVVPAVVRGRPGLTIMAALGCVALQLCAMIFHLSRGEVAVLPVNVVFLALAAFIAWGRWRQPILAR